MKNCRREKKNWELMFEVGIIDSVLRQLRYHLRFPLLQSNTEESVALGNND